MTHQLYDKLADLLVRYSLKVKPGDLICLQGSDITVPMMGPLARAVLAVGGHPFADLSVEDVIEAVHEAPGLDQTRYINELPINMIKTINGIIKLHGVRNTKYLSAFPLERIKAYQEGQAPFRREYFRRLNDKSLKWCVSLFPCHSVAQDSNMSLWELEELAFRSCLLDKPDPVAAWQEVGREQERIAKILRTKHTIRAVGPGTDLTVTCEGRNWVSCCGENNMPDGEIFTSPVESETQGQITFSYPAIFNSREVENVVLKFRDGDCVDASATKDEEYLHSMLATDEGAKRLGEFAFGTNAAVTSFTKNILFDEKIDGTIHCALGNAYSDAGGTNQSLIHWDMICNLKQNSQVYADGEKVYENGKFLI
jgi:aminopeptidase